MLYLEDYLEMIEHLPQELRDRFTEMRELDLSVQNSMDSLEKKTRAFFMQCKKGEIQNDAAELEYQNLRKEYYKVLEDADEKVAIATQIHELVERYLRRLDSELFKFKCELEADNNGITEILEKRSLELDGCNASSVIGIGQKENRYFGLTSNNYGISVGGMGMSGGMSSSQLKDNRYRQKPEKRRNSSNASLAGTVEKRPNLGVTNTAATPVAVVRPLTPNLGVAHHTVITPTATAPTAGSSVTYNLQHMGGAGNAIAAAASQAIVATQQMQQGRRTASLKASYEAIHGSTTGSGTHEFWINRDLSGSATAGNMLQSVEREAAGSSIHGQQQSRKQKKKLSSNLTHQTANITSSISLPSSTSSLSSHADSTSSSGDLIPSSSSGSVGITILGTTPIGSGSSSSVASSSSNRNVLSSSVNNSVAATPVTSDSGLVVEQTPDGEWSYDPNEPRYCTCNQVSYGDMVACDNDACPYEWFHYPCVGITQPPKGKWYCPKCTASMRRRGNRKN